MNGAIETSIPEAKPPGIIRATAVGLGLSIVTSAMTIAAFLVLITFVLIPITDGGDFSELPISLAQETASGNVAYLATMIVLELSAFIFVEICSIVPVMIVGGLIGLVMQLLAFHNHLNRWPTMILGALLGIGVGLIAESIYRTNIRYEAMTLNLEPFPLVSGTIGAAWGLLQSLLQLAWFRWKMR